VIAMLMGDQDSIQIFCADAHFPQAPLRLPRPKTAIHQHPCATRLHEGRISLAATAQTDEAHGLNAVPRLCGSPPLPYPGDGRRKEERPSNA